MYFFLFFNDMLNIFIDIYIYKFTLIILTYITLIKLFYILISKFNY